MKYKNTKKGEKAGMAMSWVLLHIGHKRVAGCRPRKRAPSITHLPR